VRADICFLWANTLDAQQVRPASLDVYKRTVQLCPEVFYYRSRIAETLSGQAEAAPQAASFDPMMEQAERVLIDAQELGPLNRGFYHLGELYMSWATHETEPEKRLALGTKAGQALDRARVFEPQTESVWIASAMVDELFLNQPAEALRKRAKAYEIVVRQDPALFGDAYLEKSGSDPFPVLQKADRLQALAYYDLALTNALSKDRNSFPAEFGKAKVWLGLDNLNQALACSLAALKSAPATNAWKAEELTARICSALTNKPAAIEHLNQAMAKAPPEAKGALALLRAQIQKLP
jgi:hypothetical protein